MVKRKPDSRADVQPMIEDLRELVQALDRRVPQFERRGETDIARDAEALKNKALERIASLEGAARADEPVSDAPSSRRTS
jgi:hypothetical protein